jgi:TrmH family RNA methyltransferase
MLSKTFAKYIQSLHHKKHRDAENAFIAEGAKVVMDLLASGNIVCSSILATAAWLEQNETALGKYYNGNIETVKDFELEKISALSTPNNVLAVFNKITVKNIITKNKLTLALDDVQDPGNLGTIIRIADWFGIENIVCSLHCADMYNPKVVQSTMGSIARVNVLYADLTEWLKNGPVKKYATALNGKNLKTVKPFKEGIIITGNESKGISDEVMKLADEKITIEKYGAAESLNAAVATGIILSHLV